MIDLCIGETMNEGHIKGIASGSILNSGRSCLWHKMHGQTSNNMECSLPSEEGSNQDVPKYRNQ